MTTGYRSADYAVSLRACHGTVQLGTSGGWLARRPIADTARHDLAGLYPFLCCGDWRGLASDIAAIRGEAVAIVTATDPLGEYSGDLLSSCFEFARPFKAHYVIDTSVPLIRHVKASHRATAARALRRVEVEVVASPEDYSADWVRLYGVLCARHGIAGLRRIAADALQAQLKVPGLVMFRASVASRTIGLDLWYVQDGCAQGHLAAFDEEGYRLRASYATKLFMIEFFRSRLAWINLGGGLAEGDGLSRFKRGFASGTKMSWLCGSIFDRSAYEELTALRGVPQTADFFPAYRAGQDF